MATLTAAQRKEIWSRYMSELSSRRELLPLTKAELQAAVDATDVWINDNIASFNTALPAPARTSLTARQKAELFFAVAKVRFNVA